MLKHRNGQEKTFSKRYSCKVVGVLTTHSPEELKDTHLNIRNFNRLEIQELENLFT
ncbi:MAG TPA: hypothetical protein VD908_21565 [Cytophagales bacterium]|nr:hypothetical protein [Cytophagales bacterium]